MDFQQYLNPYYSDELDRYTKDTNEQIQYCGAVAYITGGPSNPEIRGTVTFTKVTGGTEVAVQVYGLPSYKPAADGNPPVGPHGFHIHETGNCTAGNPAEPFSLAGGHWNPTNQPHGNHAGDFPVLFSNNGYSRMTFFTNQFRVDQIIDRAVIIHESPDDYRTQPSGASGRRLACGVIQRISYL